MPASVKKHAHFTQILATQLAAEQQIQLPGGGLKSQIQFDLALRLMKQAYEAPPVGSPHPLKIENANLI